MQLSNYQNCSREEKRLLLAAFWSRQSSTNPRVSAACVEYGPVALALIAITTVEFTGLSSLLLWRHLVPEAALAGLFALFGAWSTWWTNRCQRSAQHYLALESSNFRSVL